MEEKELIDSFHRLWYSKGQLQMRIGEGDDQVVVQLDANYCGKYLIQKNPLDLWIYQEILWECKPDLIVEMGTASGASALFMAHVLDLIGNGQIITVDIDNRLGIVPPHDRITYVVGDSVNPLIRDEIQNRTDGKKVMVILDDDHSTPHVIQELMMYWRLVTSGQYLIVEDTNVDAPLNFGYGPGWAVKEFLSLYNEQFEVDRRREKFLMTWNPGGYLRRK
jgi:cephalosporin hydroxylase